MSGLACSEVPEIQHAPTSPADSPAIVATTSSDVVEEIYKRLAEKGHDWSEKPGATSPPKNEGEAGKKLRDIFNRIRAIFGQNPIKDL